MTSPCHETTQMLAELANGDGSAADRLLPLVYDELRGLAAAALCQERADHTLQPTALVHEAYLKLVGQEKSDFNDRVHFRAVAAEAIRRVLIDHARGKKAGKRGGDFRRITLADADVLPERAELDLVALDDALERLRGLHARQAEVVKLRFFGGLTGDETAHVLGVNRSTVVDDWIAAKAWLLGELSDGDAS